MDYLCHFPLYHRITTIYDSRFMLCITSINPWKGSQLISFDHLPFFPPLCDWLEADIHTKPSS